MLLVEPDKELRASLGRVLLKAGYDCTQARDAAWAIRHVAERAPAFDLIITDLILPRTNGNAFAERVLAAHPEVPILFISSDPEDILAERKIRLPSREMLLEKPFRPEELLDRVRSILQPAVSHQE